MNCAGTAPVANDLLNKYSRNGASTSAQLFKMRLELDHSKIVYHIIIIIIIVY